MDDEAPLVLTLMPRKSWKVDKAVLQNGYAQEAKVAVVLRTNRTLATNIHGEALTTLRRFHPLSFIRQSTSEHSINTSQLAAASGHRFLVLDSGGYVQSAHFRQGLILHIHQHHPDTTYLALHALVR